MNHFNKVIRSAVEFPLFLGLLDEYICFTFRSQHRVVSWRYGSLHFCTIFGISSMQRYFFQSMNRGLGVQNGFGALQMKYCHLKNNFRVRTNIIRAYHKLSIDHSKYYCMCSLFALSVCGFLRDRWFLEIEI